MNETVTLNSGVQLQLGLAPFSVGMKLFKTIANELKVVDVNIDTLDFAKLAGKDVNVFKNAILQLLGSDALEVALFQCMERCLYNGEKITRQTFEPENARQDYLPVAWEVMKYNLAPFFKGLALSSSTAPKPTDQSP